MEYARESREEGAAGAAEAAARVRVTVAARWLREHPDETGVLISRGEAHPRPEHAEEHGMFVQHVTIPVMTADALIPIRMTFLSRRPELTPAQVEHLLARHGVFALLQ